MKLTLICIGAIAVSLLMGFALNLMFPSPIDMIACFVAGWTFGYYVVSPIVIKELGL